MKQILSSKRFALILLAFFLVVSVSLLVAFQRPDDLVPFLQWAIPAFITLLGFGVKSDQDVPMGSSR
jgi:hypothetical protein